MLSNLLSNSCSQYFLTILCISVLSVNFSFISDFIYLGLLYFLMSLVKGSFILYIFSKNQLLVSLIFIVFCFVLFCFFVVSVSFISALIFYISFLPLSLGFVVLFVVLLGVELDYLFEGFYCCCCCLGFLVFVGLFFFFLLEVGL
ncbi:hypothetical protein HJG60_007890 [Phyllostomus discolor]|uniref:Uncharacterized protein n=1 Tax=Phyllostomus discolor TaxID=89673 RepID=A0A834EVA6_9CHIR|nr:hypothetical protein HJG60_007890 [Phyllostomus discolor]